MPSADSLLTFSTFRCFSTLSSLVDVGTPVEDSADLLVVVTIVSENVPQEHQLRKQAVLITQSSGPVYQCGKCSINQPNDNRDTVTYLP
jgi:hypothetical protein